MTDDPKTTKYVAISRSWRSEDTEGWQDRPTVQVVESESAPIKTGLLDANGTPLYRIQDRVPLGFHIRNKSHD